MNPPQRQSPVIKKLRVVGAWLRASTRVMAKVNFERFGFRRAVHHLAGADSGTHGKGVFRAFLAQQVVKVVKG